MGLEEHGNKGPADGLKKLAGMASTIKSHVHKEELKLSFASDTWILISPLLKPGLPNLSEQISCEVYVLYVQIRMA